MKGQPEDGPSRPAMQLAIVAVSAAILIVSIGIAVVVGYNRASQESSPPTATLTPAAPPCVGRSPGTPESFSVYPDYAPEGYMGDTGDIKDPDKDPEGARFTYEVRGRGPHEGELKYKDGKLNPDPAKFAGVMYLCCGWGEKPGRDLRAFRRAIAWEARSLSGEVNVEFVIGGVDWIWDEDQKVRISPPCPDSLRRKHLGVVRLTEEWTEFEIALADIPEEEFVNVIGAFAWVITWGSNGMELDPAATPPAPIEPKTFVIEIRNIRYER